jgi:fused signal recognition particle receptor
VIFETLQEAKANQADVVLLDTAGRLQNKFNLMAELQKIYQVIQRAEPDVLESLLVLDATTGQNALKQAEVFQQSVSLTGVALTKLDGSAKGGIVLTVVKEHRLPVKLVGVGEGIEDLKLFDAQAFIDGLFGS